MPPKKNAAAPVDEDLVRETALKVVPALLPLFCERTPAGEVTIRIRESIKLSYAIAKEFVNFVDEPEPEPSGLVIP